MSRESRFKLNTWMETINGEKVETGTKIQYRNEEPYSNPLHKAVQTKNRDLLYQLLGLDKFDIDSKNWRGETALHIACRKKRPELVKLLLHHNASKLIKDSEGYIPLQIAISMESKEIIEILR